MASDKRPIIKLRSTAGTGYVRDHEEQDEHAGADRDQEYDPVIRQHVIFKEER